MNKRKVIATVGILGGLGIIGYSIYYYFKKQAELIQNFTYTITGINFTQFDLGVIKGDLSVAFTNTSNIEVMISEFYVDFYFNDEYVGYLQDTTPFVIKGMQTTPVTTQFTLSPQIILGNITDIIIFSNQYKDAKFTVKGYAKAKSGFITATVPIEFGSTLRELGFI